MEAQLWQTILVGILVIITGYYAYQTRRQANLFDRQLKAMADQRRKSIQPSLQIDDILPQYHRRQIEGVEKDVLIPDLFLQISNVGSGPSVDLEISATVVIDFYHEDSQVGAFRKLQFKLHKRSKDFYLERMSEPVQFWLDLTRIDIPDSEDSLGLAQVKFKFRDIDQSPLSDTKLVQLAEDRSRIGIDDEEISPSHNNYPTHLLPLL